MMKKIFTVLLFALSTQILYSQADIVIENKDKSIRFEHKITAGFNFGATTPLPIPEEVRSVGAWWPQFGAQLGYNIIMRGSGNWGVGSGILLDYKGMGVRDKVKYMYTTVDVERGGETGKFEGYFTGENQTIVKNAYLTVPIYATYFLKEKWNFRLGMYISYLFSSEFSGEVKNGYIREGDYTGKKVEIDYARFNFGDKLRYFDLGLIGGAEYKWNDRFGTFANLNYGLTSIFKSSFKGVGFKMYNLYVSLGMTYTL